MNNFFHNFVYLQIVEIDIENLEFESSDNADLNVGESGDDIEFQVENELEESNSIYNPQARLELKPKIG